MAADPWRLFDAVACVHVSGWEPDWTAMDRRLAMLGLQDRVTLLRPDPVLVDPGTIRAMTHREALRGAASAATLLVLESDCLLLRNATCHLAAVASAVAAAEWDLLYLGAATWGNDLTPVPGCPSLATGAFTGTHAIAYRRSAIDALLAEMPQDAPLLADWVAREPSFDAHLGNRAGRVLLQPCIASTRVLLPYEDPALREGFVA